MSTPVINQAWKATSAADDGIVEVCLTIRDHQHNVYGVYTNPTYVLERLKKGHRQLGELIDILENKVQWPTTADYDEV